MVTVISSITTTFRMVPKRHGKGTGRFENQGMHKGYPNYSIVEIDQNTENSTEDKCGFTSLSDYQLTSVWKTRKMLDGQGDPLGNVQEF